MVHRKKVAAAAVAVVTMMGGQVAVWTTAQAVPDRQNPGIARLHDDSTGGLRLEREASGAVGFVGTTAGHPVHNPTVAPTADVRVAARSHLARYGAALGLAGDAELSLTRTERSVSGHDVVRFQQEVGSAPVIGGQVTVSLDGDRQLTSMLSTVSTLDALPTATVSETDARVSALRAVTGKDSAAELSATSEGRWVWDPAVLGVLDGPVAQGVWRFEVGDGQGVRRLVLVDDTSGRVLLDLDQIQHADRVVCDSSNEYSQPSPCASDFARVEGGPASAVADVNAAYDHAGSTSTAYAQIAGIDLTETIGITVGGVKKLASTVRFCHPADPCPMDNAFWNGSQMYYGDGFAGADDVVGHEMTHGVIDQYSELFYWGQSGAINESMADIMGEIVDHRAGLVLADDDWLLGEDLPVGAIRSMKDPGAFGDPDRMTSPSYTADPTYGDSGGVHFNSGVGNKTAYLISQGGSFNGQTITGIDDGEPGLTKTGKLYFDAIARLTSGSDYADLAAVLEQSCADFVAVGTAGFTAGDCANIAKAVLATELRTTPPAAPQPAEAVKGCPTGTTLRELLNSETGNQASKFTDSTGLWGYGVSPIFGSNAISGKDSWLGLNPDPETYGDPPAGSLRAVAGIAVPAGQQTYLHFQQWRLFEWYPGGPNPFIDGGTVEIVAGAGPVDAAGLPWVNGPQQTLQTYSSADPNQWAGLRAFAGDSFGWTSSQLDLSSFAGQTIKPQFTVRGDPNTSEFGWWLDDIVVYTCDVPAPPTSPPTTAPTSQPTTATLPPAPTVPPVVQQVSTTKVAVGKVRPGRSVKVTAIVKIATGVPTGRVTFKIDGKKVVKTRDLTNGKAILKLSRKLQFKLGRGKHKVKVMYLGSPTAMTSTGRTTFNLR